jgi:hypothetical protein
MYWWRLSVYAAYLKINTAVSIKLNLKGQELTKIGLEIIQKAPKKNRLKLYTVLYQVPEIFKIGNFFGII